MPRSQNAARTLLDQLDDSAELLVPSWAKSAQWVFGELRDAWSSAVTDTDLAREHWRRNPGLSAYTTFLAAMDRADAAQDALARWALAAQPRRAI